MTLKCATTSEASRSAINGVTRPEGFRQLASSKGSEDPRADRRAQHYGLMALPQRSDLVADTTRERRSLLPALRWVAVAGAVVGAVLYSNWLLEIVFTRMLPDPDLIYQ